MLKISKHSPISICSLFADLACLKRDADGLLNSHFLPVRLLWNLNKYPIPSITRGSWDRPQRACWDGEGPGEGQQRMGERGTGLPPFNYTLTLSYTLTQTTPGSQAVGHDSLAIPCKPCKPYHSIIDSEINGFLNHDWFWLYIFCLTVCRVLLLPN